jgi:hypothetical protein
MVQRLLCAFLFLGILTGLEAAPPDVPKSLIGRYLPVQSKAFIDGYPVGDYDALLKPLPIRKNYLREFDGPNTLAPMLKALKAQFRNQFPRASVKSFKVSSQITRVQGGFLFRRRDNLFVNLPSICTTGTGSIVYSGILLFSGKMKSSYVISLDTTDPLGKSKNNLVIKLIHRKKF